jgi:hypothetical protein
VELEAGVTVPGTGESEDVAALMEAGRPVSAGRQRAPVAVRRKMVEATRTVAAASGRRRVRPRGAIGGAGHGLVGGGNMAAGDLEGNHDNCPSTLGRHLGIIIDGSQLI